MKFKKRSKGHKKVLISKSKVAKILMKMLIFKINLIRDYKILLKINGWICIQKIK